MVKQASRAARAWLNQRGPPAEGWRGLQSLGPLSLLLLHPPLRPLLPRPTQHLLVSVLPALLLPLHPPLALPRLHPLLRLCCPGLPAAGKALLTGSWQPAAQHQPPAARQWQGSSPAAPCTRRRPGKAQQGS